nr:unnamed protein product [Naegleria fowleri]
MNYHKPLPQPPSFSSSNKPLPVPSSTFQPITEDEEELLSLMRMDGANMFVIGLWNDVEVVSSRRLSKIKFDTMCYISEDGKALVCESDMVPSSSGSLTCAQRRSNIILFSEVEKILPYYQCFDLLENGDNQSTFITALTTSSSLSISSKIPITPQEAQECISFFQRYFISGYENKDQNYERALIPYMYQMFMVKRKNFKKNLGFILSGM